MTEHNPSLSSLSDHLAEVVDGAAAFVVGVRTRRRAGTGVVYGEGLVVTAAHGVWRASSVTLTLPDGTSAKAEVVGRDRATDLALLKTDATLPAPAPWSDGQDLRVGHLAVVVGRPGRGLRAGLGIMSGLSSKAWTTPLGGEIDRYLGVDATLPGGFSGGPLVSADGGFIGINTRGLVRGGTTVPASTVQRVVDAIREQGDLEPGYLGVVVQTAERDGTTGLLITALKTGGPGAEAGLQPGDVIVEVAGRTVTSVDELAAALHGAAGTEVAVVALSGGERLETTAKLTQRRRRAC